MNESTTHNGEPGASRQQPFSWSVRARTVASFLILGYLFVVVMGPLANPVGSQHLTRPIGQFLLPIQNSLFTGHGYRFFGPDPGPSHLLLYKVKKSDGVIIEGRIPNRNDGDQWPRLLYHRWFMLSERVYEEHIGTLDEESHLATLAEFDRRAKELQKAGGAAQAKQLLQERRRQAEDYTQARARIDALVTAIAKHLLKNHDGQSVELFVQERVIPQPVDVAMGKELDDKDYLAAPAKVFEFSIDGVKKSVEEIFPNQQPLHGPAAKSNEGQQ